MASPRVELIGVDRVAGDLERETARLPGAMKRQTKEAGELLVDEVRRNVRAKFQRHSGQLEASIEAEVDANRREAEATVTSEHPGAHTQEFGATIVPRSARFLVFPRGGGFVRARRVVVPATPFMQPALERREDDLVETVGDAFEVYG